MGFRSWIGVIGLLLAVGCGGPSPVPARGTVLYKGEPVPDANVTFVPVGSGEDAMVATGTTDAQGKFVLTTVKPEDGAVPGAYTVTLTPKSGEATDADYSMPEAPKFPVRYVDATASDLKVEVKSGAANDFPLELKEE